MIRVNYYYSACIGIVTPDVSILCDPWFTQGIYYGSWYHYPPFPNAIENIPKYDYIYVSHIHEDHYDVVFLRKYLAKHPETKIIIADDNPNFLSKLMTKEGVPHQICPSLTIGETHLKIFPNDPDDKYNVDSALVVKWQNHSVVNMNDCLFRPPQLDKILEFCPNPTISLLPFAGAGPYPQTYHDDKITLEQKAEIKKEQFFERYIRLRDYLKPKKNIPFAGSYMLGGHLVDLNHYRGVADAIEINDIDENCVVLADGGHASINTQTLHPTALRTQPYDPEEIKKYLESIRHNKMECDIYFENLPYERMNMPRLFVKAFKHALPFSRITRDYYFCVKLPDQWFVCNINKDKEEFSFRQTVDDITPRSEIHADYKFLFGLLTFVFHWNNAELSCQYQTRRYPDVFDQEVQNFLNFFHL